MIITYIEDLDDSAGSRLVVNAPEIATFIEDIADYTKVDITATINCSATNSTQEYDTTEVLDIDSKYYIEENILYIKPEFFSLTEFQDGIYKLDIKFTNSEEGYTLISNCFFVDITFKCKVAGLLQNIIKENRKAGNEKVSTIIHILHYALTNASNCGCNCNEMCTVFGELKTLLLNVDSQINSDCANC